MNSRVWSIASRRLRSSPRGLAPPKARTQQRFASSDRQPSNVSEFYKTFTRPVAKVLLMAVFTYQLAYWGWVKLEQDEIRAEREAEIAALEHKVARLSPPNPPAGQRPSGPRHGDPMKGLHDADAAVQHGGDREPDRLKPGGAPQASLEEYKRQLAELEERYQDALAKAREEGANEGAKGSQSTAPWWKVW